MKHMIDIRITEFLVTFMWLGRNWLKTNIDERQFIFYGNMLSTIAYHLWRHIIPDDILSVVTYYLQ